MRKIITAIIGGIIAFSAGLIGVYLAMPTLAPDVVEEVRARIDSLTVVDSLARPQQPGQTPPSRPPGSVLGVASGDSSVFPSPPVSALDSLGVNEGIAHVSDAAGSTDQSLYEAMVVSMKDSLDVLQSKVQALEEEKSSLRTVVETLRQQQADRAAQRADVQELSKTLIKLEDKELARVVEQLDGVTLEALYREASSRDRTRLLQAMPASYAAAFVQRLVQPGTASQPSDTLTAAERPTLDTASVN